MQLFSCCPMVSDDVCMLTGHFGQVYSGMLKDDGQRGLATARVAVKTLQGGSWL